MAVQGLVDVYAELEVFGRYPWYLLLCRSDLAGRNIEGLVLQRSEQETGYIRRGFFESWSTRGTLETFLAFPGEGAENAYDRIEEPDEEGGREKYFITLYQHQPIPVLLSGHQTIIIPCSKKIAYRAG